MACPWWDKDKRVYAYESSHQELRGKVQEEEKVKIQDGYKGGKNYEVQKGEQKARNDIGKGKEPKLPEKSYEGGYEKGYERGYGEGYGVGYDRGYDHGFDHGVGYSKDKNEYEKYHDDDDEPDPVDECVREYIDNTYGYNKYASRAYYSDSD